MADGISASRHSIRQQTLELQVDSEALALTLQPHIGDINRRRFIPLIERVFDELDVPEQHVRIARLDVDLGELPAGNFEQAAEEALYPALRRAVEEAVRAARDRPSQDQQIRPEASSRLGLLEHYLSGGTLPFWAPAGDFSAEDLLLQLAASDPTSLAVAIRRHARDRRVLERLAFQLDQAALEALLRLLSPEHAALILTYMFDLHQTHRTAPLLALSEAAFKHLLWVLVLNYVLNDPGSQFNRKSFVRFLLQGLAESAGFEYQELVETLHRGLLATAQRHPLTSSLLAIVVELEREIIPASRLGAASASDSALLDDATEQQIEGTPQKAGSPLDAIAEDLRRDGSFSAASLLPRMLGTSSSARSNVAARQAIELVQQPSANEPDLGDAEINGDAPQEILETESSGSEDQHLRATPDRVFQHYDQIEILRYYLARGLLPWGALLRYPELTADSILAGLSRFSPAQLRLVFPGSAQERAHLVESALRQLPEDRVLAMLTPLLAEMPAESPFRSALASFAAKAGDRPAFYTRVISALLNGDTVDLEAAAGEARPFSAPEALHGKTLEEWDIGALKSLLASRLRFGVAPWPEAPALSDILDILVARHRGEARQFLEILAEAPDLMQALVREIPQTQLPSVLHHVFPAETSVVRGIMDALAASPQLLQPLTEERRRELLLSAVLRLARGRAEDVFISLLRRLVSTPVTHETRQLLLGQAGRWRTSSAASPLRASDIAPFETAVERFSSEAAESFSDNNKPVLTGTSTALREAVFAWLRDGRERPSSGSDGDVADVRTLSDDTLVYQLERMVAAAPEDVSSVVHQHAIDPDRRARWADELPDSALARLIYVLAPRHYGWLLAAADILLAAWRETAPTGQRPVPDRALLWNFLLDMAAAEGNADLSPGRLVAAFFARTASGDPRLAATLFERATHRAEAAGNAALVSVLQRESHILLPGDHPIAPAKPGAATVPAHQPQQRPRAAAPPPPSRGKTAFQLRSEDNEIAGKPIYISNAGLALTSPFLPHLFHTLDMLEPNDKGGQRIRADALTRAVHLLQYLVDGRTNAPEPLLVLNKLLCGALTAAPVARTIEITETERDLCERLLGAMISTWKSIEHTSVAGLRETFLQRKGKLQYTDGGWKLRVQRKTLDVLVDQTPWSFSTIFHSWMPQPIHVSW